MVNVGIIGLGHMGGYHSSASQLIQGLNLVAVADTNVDNLKKIKSIEYIHKNFEGLHKLFHTIKGGSLNITANRISHYATILDEMVKSNNNDKKEFNKNLSSLFLEFNILKEKYYSDISM